MYLVQLGTGERGPVYLGRDRGLRVGVTRATSATAYPTERGATQVAREYATAQVVPVPFNEEN